MIKMSSSTERSDINNHDNKQDLIIPKLRNNLFKDNWSTKKLGDISKIIMGQSPSSSNYSDDTDDTILIQGNQDLNNGLVVPRIYTSEITKISKPGDIILTVRAPVGDIAINEYDCCIGRGVCSITPHENKLFIYYYLQYLNNKKIWNKYSQGSTFESVNSKDIKNLKIKIPSINEQNYISEFLSSIDKKIEFMEKKYNHYNHFKKYLLQNFFNDNYSSNGFKKLFGASEFIKLGELASIQTGNKDLKDKKEDGKYPFFVRSEKIERIDTYSFDGEAILIPGDGKIGEIYHYINGKFDYHQRVYKISNFENVMGKYVYYYLEENFLREAKRNTAKATVDSLRLSTIINMKIKLPDITVQNKIVDILSLTDKKIYSLQKGITLNKEFKRSLLSKMFC